MFSCFASQTSVPSFSSMRSKMCGAFGRQPPFGNIVYASASSASVISLLPRNVAGKCRSWERMPAEVLSCKTASTPASIPMRTVAPFFDLAIACLAVIAPS